MISSADNRLSSATLSETVRRGVGWWLGELRAMVPAAFLARAPGKRTCDLTIRMLPDGELTVETQDTAPLAVSSLEFAGVVDAIAERGRSATLHLDVPRTLCLVRASTLPRQALRAARAILGHEMTESTPLRPEAVLWDWYVEAEDPVTGQLHLRQVVLGRDRIARITTVVEAAGLSLSRITVDGSQGRGLPVDLLSTDDASLRGFIKGLSRPARLLWAAALAILLCLPFLVALRSGQTLEGLTAQKLDTMTKVRGLPPLDEPSLAAVDVLGRAPKLTVLLDEISARQTTDVYYTGIDLADGRIRLRLGGGDPAALRASFDRSAILTALPAERADPPDSLALEVRPPVSAQTEYKDD
ncbi:hypothetical protein [Rhizobium sp. NFR03]|uniref:hypothetical protein n=1 Tax=Rhizobium sp. NFR03 TaxID=1566263 RepID=UPI0008CFF3B7|nr:hypothetical protein [Rhizobium sp. NFR03]SES28423.1 hypothetical protein SAMN03159406_03245 [Rhizobium sp. NFR03]